MSEGEEILGISAEWSPHLRCFLFPPAPGLGSPGKLAGVLLAHSLWTGSQYLISNRICPEGPISSQCLFLWRSPTDRRKRRSSMNQREGEKILGIPGRQGSVRAGSPRPVRFAWRQ